MVIHGKKACGILTEMSVSKDGTWYVVIGTGINVNGRDFDEVIADTATSLLLETKAEELLDRQEIMDAVMACFSKNYKLFVETGDLKKLLQSYNQVLINRGKEIRVLEPSGDYTGISDGINEKGELLVTREDGTCTAVYAGEVSVRGVYGYV